MAAIDTLIPPDFVRPETVEDLSDQLHMLTFPGGFSCYALSPDEAALIYNEIMVKQEYFKHGLAIDHARCVLDVGANIGLFTLAAKLRAPDAIIYSFEAISDTFEVLEQNVILHDYAEVHLFNMAVGAQDGGERTFLFYPHMAGNSTANPEIKDAQRPAMDYIFGQEMSGYLHDSVTRTAPVRTLSSIIREEGISLVDYLKIDVEGDEMAVLAGIEDDHWPMIKQVAIEAHSEELRRQVCETLSARGFDVFTDLGISSPVGVSDVYARRL